MKRSVERRLSIIFLFVLAWCFASMLSPTTVLAEIVLPSALTRVEDSAFQNNKNMVGLVEVPAKTAYIGESAFAGTNVYAVDFPNGVASICSNAVMSESLNYVIVRNPSAVIADDAFAGANYIFADEGSRAQMYAYAAGIRFVRLTDLVLKDGFYYEVTDDVSLLCAKDATKIPDSLSVPDRINDKPVRTIAPYAFKGCEQLRFLELPHNNMVTNDALDNLKTTQITYRNTVPVIESIRPSLSGSIYAGQNMVWTVQASSATGDLSYAYYLNKDGDVISSSDYGKNNSYSAALNEAGYYSLTVVCKDGNGLTATAESQTIRVFNRPLTIQTVAAEKESYATGDKIVWNVAASNGTAPILHHYVLYRNGIVLDRQDMVPDSTYSYTPNDIGEYVLEVTCVDADETQSTMRSNPVQVSSSDEVLINGETEAEWMGVSDLGAGKQLVITSTGRWTASASPWIQLSSTSGNSGDTITATVQENSGAARSGQIVFSTGSAAAVMAVQQYAALKEIAYLNDFPYSLDMGKPTLVSEETIWLRFNWDVEPQVDRYTLTFREVGGSIIDKAELENGESSFSFLKFNPTPGKIYSLYFERFVRGRYRDGVWYYLQAAVEDPWILANNKTSNYSELEADEDYERFTITSNGMWAAKSSADWIMVYDDYITQADLDEWLETSDMYQAHIGDSGEELYISVLANPTGKTRTGNVVITSGSATYTIPVTQYHDYTIAELTSPALATRKSDSTSLPYGSVTLRWTAGSEVTGKYQVMVYESDNQSSGYDIVAFNTGRTTSRSCTIPVSSLKEGYYYEVYLKTEVTSGEYMLRRYYFRMSRANELTLTAQPRSNSVSVGGYIGIDAIASGGAGKYVYTYILMKNGTEVARSSAHSGITYYTFPVSEAGNYYVVVYVQDADGTVASSTTGTISVGTSGSTATPTPTPAATPGSGTVPTPTPTATPRPAQLSAPVISEDPVIESNGTLTIDWNKVEGAAGYKVWRSISSTSGYAVIGVINDANTCQWSDHNLMDGVEYFYKVQAVAQNGAVSAFSGIASGRAVNTDAPSDGQTTSIMGFFSQENYGIEIGGNALQLTGRVFCAGSTIQRVTINVKGVRDNTYLRLMTREFSGNQTSINLADYAEFQPDTSAYPFNEPGTYTLQLWASTADGSTLTSPLATTTLTVVRFDAKLCDESGKASKTIVLGDKWTVNGNVSVEGNTLGRVTVNAYAVVNSSMTDDFRDHSVSSVELQNWAAYTIDTTKAPFNREGTYTLHVWAKDVSGVGGSHSLAQMTVKVVEETYYGAAAVSARMDELYSKLGNPKFFTVNRQSCNTSFQKGHACSNCYNENVLNANWFKNIFGTISCNWFPTSYDSSSGYTQRGWSCLGFAHFAEYWLYRDPNNPATKVSTKKIGTYQFNLENATTYAQTGDVIRFGSSHSAICYYSDEDGMYVLDSNWGMAGAQCRVDRHYIPYSNYATFTISRAYNAEQ